MLRRIMASAAALQGMNLLGVNSDWQLILTGGILVLGWHNRIKETVSGEGPRESRPRSRQVELDRRIVDRNGFLERAKAGQTVNDTKLTEEGKVLHVTTGPAATFWNPKNKARGDYTVSATFT